MNTIRVTHGAGHRSQTFSTVSKRISAALLGAVTLCALVISPSAAMAEQTEALEESGGITVAQGDTTSLLTEDTLFGKVLSITSGWTSGSSQSGVPVRSVGTITDASVFKASSWTLSMDVKRTDNDSTTANFDKKAALTVGTANNALNLLLGNGKLGFGATTGGNSASTVPLSKNAGLSAWSAVSVVYKEDASSGTVAVYMNGSQVLAPTSIGFKLSETDGVRAFVGHGFNTSFALTGLYDNIVVSNTAAEQAAAESDTASRLQTKKDADSPVPSDSGRNGYLWLHFEATDYEKIYYGYSANGVSWNKLNDNQAIITSQVSNKGIRDPHLIKLEQPDADGYRYVMIGTDLHAEGTASGESWSQQSKSVIISRSKDLVTWTAAEAVFAGWDDADRVWAPEAIWDSETNDYLVYWSSKPVGGSLLGVYKTHTKDFKTFSTPELWLDESAAGNYNIIDTTIVKGEDGDYYRFSTSDWNTVIDTSPTLESKTWIRLVDRAQAINSDGTSKIPAYQGQSQKIITTTAAGLGNIEGLTVFRMADGSWRIMGDNQGYRAFSINRLSRLKDGAAPTTTSVTFDKRFRHGTVVELTAAEQKAVLKAYGNEQEETPLAKFDFNTLTAGSTTIDDVNGLAKATVNGNISVGTNTLDGTAAANLAGNTWLNVTKADGSPLLAGQDEVTFSYESLAGTAKWSLFAAPNATAQVYNSENYLGVMDQPSALTVERYKSGRGANGNVSTTGKNGWKHVDVVVSSSATKIYVDGVLKDTNSTIDANHALSAIIGSAGGILQVGKANWGSGEYFNGQIDNLTIWDRALSDDELISDDADVLTGALVGSVPEDTSVTGTDTHTAITSAVDSASKTITAYVRSTADLKAVPVKLTLNGGSAQVQSVNGQPFINGGTVDFSAGDATVVVARGDKSETWTIHLITANNPVLPGQYADPDIDVFDGKFWIYPTTDGFSSWSGTQFHAWSSTDMVHWKDEGIILDVNKDASNDYPKSSWSVGSGWAPTIEKKNGKYYLYYCAKQSDGVSAIGVAVADSPSGPFVAQPQPLVTNNMEGTKVSQAIDPSIFTEDDGTSYILYGNGSAAIAELNDDMVSIKPGTVRKLSGLTDFREALTVNKIDGKYHWTWSCDDTGSENYHVNYGISDTLTGAITYKYTLLAKDVANDIKGTGHHSILRNGDDYYITYARFYTPLDIYTSGLGYHREVSIDKLTIGADGLLQKVTPTLTGVAATTVKENDSSLRSLNIDGHSLDVAKGSQTLTVDDVSGVTADDVVAVTSDSSADKKITVEGGVVTIVVTADDLSTSTYTVTLNDGSVPAATIRSIEVKSAPTTTEYTVGDVFSADGLVIEATLSDNSTRPLTAGEYTLSGVDTSSAGKKTVTVTLLDDATITTSFDITVKEPGSGLIDTSDLQAWIAKAEALKPADYTSGTWTAVATQLEKAKDVLSDPHATQEQVDSSASALRAAISKLEKATGSSDVDNFKASGPAGEDVERLSNTGAGVGDIALAATLCLCLAVGMVAMRRRIRHASNR